MAAIVFVDVVAALFVIAGSQIAFNPSLMRRLFRREPPAPTDTDQRAETAAVLRMVGVMIMAFAFTLATLVTLITIYSRP
jgi:hypothetical protein